MNLGTLSRHTGVQSDMLIVLNANLQTRICNRALPLCSGAAEEGRWENMFSWCNVVNDGVSAFHLHPKEVHPKGSCSSNLSLTERLLCAEHHRGKREPMIHIATCHSPSNSAPSTDEYTCCTWSSWLRMG